MAVTTRRESIANSLDNIPPEAMPGVEDALVNALNEDNRVEQEAEVWLQQF